MTSIEDKIKKIMTSVFDVSCDEINDEISPYSVKNWDSLNHIKMVLEFEKQFRISFDQDEIPTLVNYRIIVATISAYID